MKPTSLNARSTDRKPPQARPRKAHLARSHQPQKSSSENRNTQKHTRKPSREPDNRKPRQQEAQKQHGAGVFHVEASTRTEATKCNPIPRKGKAAPESQRNGHREHERDTAKGLATYNTKRRQKRKPPEITRGTARASCCSTDEASPTTRSNPMNRHGKASADDTQAKARPQPIQRRHGQRFTDEAAQDNAKRFKPDRAPERPTLCTSWLLDDEAAPERHKPARAPESQSKGKPESQRQNAQKPPEATNTTLQGNLPPQTKKSPQTPDLPEIAQTGKRCRFWMMAAPRHRTPDRNPMSRQKPTPNASSQNQSRHTFAGFIHLQPVSLNTENHTKPTGTRAGVLDDEAKPEARATRAKLTDQQSTRSGTASTLQTRSSTQARGGKL